MDTSIVVAFSYIRSYVRMFLCAGYHRTHGLFFDQAEDEESLYIYYCPACSFFRVNYSASAFCLSSSLSPFIFLYALHFENLRLLYFFCLPSDFVSLTLSFSVLPWSGIAQDLLCSLSCC